MTLHTYVPLELPPKSERLRLVTIRDKHVQSDTYEGAWRQNGPGTEVATNSVHSQNTCKVNYFYKPPPGVVKAH